MRTDSEEVIRRLIIHSLLEDLNEQESRALENWLKTPEHQDFYKKISRREYGASHREIQTAELVGEGSRDCAAVVYVGRRLVLLAK